jgi:selenocysteine lyase/cysteine desulfurase
MGERDHFISMEMASIGMEMMATWGTQAVVSRLSALTRRISDGLASLNAVGIPDGRFRAPHILCLGFAGDVLTSLIPTLASQQVYVAARLGRMRISPHVYNDEADADRFVASLTRAIV